MASQASGPVPVLERLQGCENWHTWKFAVKTYLETEELWEAIEPEKKEDGTLKPVPPAMNRKARGKIILGLDPSLFVHVEATKTAKEAWEKLVETFEDTGLTRRWGLLHKLVTTNLKSCGYSMETYVTRMVSTAHQLHGVGFTISDEWLGMLLLAGLPMSYKPMVMALENSGAAITGDLIKTKLLQEVQSPTEAVEVVEQALVLKGPRGRQCKQGTSSNQLNGVKCHKCGNFGHFARECALKSSSMNQVPKKGGKSKQGSAFGIVLNTMAEYRDNDWFFDSGASRHLTRTKSLLKDVRQADGTMFAANKDSMKIVAEGDAALYPSCGGDIDVHDVQVIPELLVNLLSVGMIVDNGHTVIFRKDGCEVINPEGSCIATGRRANGLFKLEQDVPKVLVCSSTSVEMWHRRTGHLSIKNLVKLRNGMATGVDFQDADCGDCKVCPMGRQTRLPFSKEGSRATEVLELVHSDICGPMEQASLGGCRYYLTFIDDKTRKMFVYFLHTKSAEEVIECFKLFKSMAERQTGHKLKVLRTDNGKEYKNGAFEKLFGELGIRHQTTVEYTPEQNGLAERANRTIVERARCMLYESKLSKSFWAEAVNTAVYLINRSPTSGIPTTPEEAWSGRKPDLSMLRVFGTTVMAHLPKQKRRKWDAKAEECVLVGFDEETKGYRVYNFKSKQLIKSRDVTFIDEAKSNPNRGENLKSSATVETTWVRLDFDEAVRDEPERAEAFDEDADDDVPMIELPDVRGPTQVEEASELGGDAVAARALPPQIQRPAVEQQVLRRSGRERVRPGKYTDSKTQHIRQPSSQSTVRSMSLKRKCGGAGASPQCKTFRVDPEASTSKRDGPSTAGRPAITAPPSSSNQRPVDEGQHGLMLSDRGCPPQGKYSPHVEVDDFGTGSDCPQSMPDDPCTHQEALARDDAERWSRAMQEEYDALVSNGTWKLTSLPEGRQAIRCKWVYKTKLNAEGKVDRYKARLVIKGYSQRKGVDYEETYSPVVRHSSLRYLFALAARMNLKIDQMDAITAFLHGELQEEIYMEQPPCFEDRDRKKVCKLNKALYGLKQSSRVWNIKLDAALKKFGLTCAEYDPCVYFKTAGDKVLFLALYVDDLLIFTNCDRWRKEIKNKLCGEFRMKDIGPAKHVLGIRVTRTKEAISLDQEAYVEAVLTRFKMSSCKAVTTPMNVDENLTRDLGPSTDEERKRMAAVPYKEAVGCLMYLGQCTRPDICHAVNVLCRFNDNPGEQHWNAVKHLMRYLRGTAKLKLTYTQRGNLDIRGYSDADWGADCEGRKSVTGYLFVAQGGAISWCSKRQQTVSLSTCEAEYMALSAAVQEALWWKRLRSRIEKDEKITLYCDNQSAIAISKNGGYHARTKHIDIRHHFITDAWERGDVDITYIKTESQLADGLTKALQRIKLETHRKSMGLTEESWC